MSDNKLRDEAQKFFDKWHDSSPRNILDLMLDFHKEQSTQSETDLSGKLKEAVEVIEQLKSRVPENDTWDKKAHFVANHFLTSLTQKK